MPEVVFAFALFFFRFGHLLPFFGRRRQGRCKNELGNTLPIIGEATLEGGVMRTRGLVNQNTCDSSPFLSRDSMLSVDSEVVIFEMF